jgi:hypothetical protein
MRAFFGLFTIHHTTSNYTNFLLTHKKGHLSTFPDAAPGILNHAGLNALYTCKAPSIHCTRPKKMARASTSAATQNVYHCTRFRRSYHHCESVLGSASSKTCFKTMSRSCQYWKLEMWRSSALKCPHLRALLSSRRVEETFLNHWLLCLLLCGKRRASVRIVSSMSPAGNSVLRMSAENAKKVSSDSLS